MNPNSLSYDCLKTVLHHMDANLRFKIAAQCPSIRNVERNVPLYIDYLCMCHDYRVSVNETFYDLSISRMSRNGSTCHCLLQKNENCELNSDLDRWGFERPSYRFVKTPGDIIVNPLGENWEQWEKQDNNYDEDDRQEEENTLREYRKELNRLRRKKLYDVSPNPLTGSSESWGQVIENCIGDSELELLPYTCRENNTDSPFNCFVRLCCSYETYGPMEQRALQKKEEGLIEQSEIVCYTKKLYETMKYLMTKMFGRRGSSIYVKVLCVGGWNQIIRLPEDVKFTARQIVSAGMSRVAFDALIPVIDDGCNPWRHVETAYYDSLDEPHIKNANEVTFYNTHPNSLQIIQNMTNEKIYLCRSNDNEFTPDKQYLFIKHILETGKKVGTYYKIGFEKEEIIMKALDLIENQMGNNVTIDINRGLVILPMSGPSALHISYGKPTRTIYCSNERPPWVLKLKVVFTDMNQD